VEGIKLCRKLIPVFEQKFRQNMTKNALFLEKNCKNCHSVITYWTPAAGDQPPTPSLLILCTLTAFNHSVLYSGKTAYCCRKRTKCAYFKLCSFCWWERKILFTPGSSRVP